MNDELTELYVLRRNYKRLRADGNWKSLAKIADRIRRLERLEERRAKRHAQEAGGAGAEEGEEEG